MNGFQCEACGKFFKGEGIEYDGASDSYRCNNYLRCSGADAGRVEQPPEPAALPAFTLRDQFAMAALTVMLANSANDEYLDEKKAKCAYNMADLMLAARWNDVPGRTLDAVLAAFDKAIEKHRRQP